MGIRGQRVNSTVASLVISHVSRSDLPGIGEVFGKCHSGMPDVVLHPLSGQHGISVFYGLYDPPVLGDGVGICTSVIISSALRLI